MCRPRDKPTSSHFSRAVRECMWFATAALDICEKAGTSPSLFPCQCAPAFRSANATQCVNPRPAHPQDHLRSASTMTSLHFANSTASTRATSRRSTLRCSQCDDTGRNADMRSSSAQRNSTSKTAKQLFQLQFSSRGPCELDHAREG